MKSWFRNVVVVAIGAASVGGVLGACDKGEPNEGKRIPKLAPPPDESIPADLRIAVEVDGREATPITAQTLSQARPDFADAKHRAWRFSTLVGEAAARPGTVVAVTGARAGDAEIELRLPSGAASVPVLMISRRGEIVAELLDPGQPFPDFHGQGGRLGRPPEATPRVSPVKRVRVFRPGQGMRRDEKR